MEAVGGRGGVRAALRTGGRNLDTGEVDRIARPEFRLRDMQLQRGQVGARNAFWRHGHALSSTLRPIPLGSLLSFNRMEFYFKRILGRFVRCNASSGGVFPFRLTTLTLPTRYRGRAPSLSRREREGGAKRRKGEGGFRQFPVIATSNGTTGCGASS